MTRFGVILVRLCSDRSASTMNRVYDACLLWGIWPCVITHRLKSVNWTRPGLDPISLCRSPDRPSGSSCSRLHQLSYFIVRILRRFHIPAD